MRLFLAYTFFVAGCAGLIGFGLDVQGMEEWSEPQRVTCYLLAGIWCLLDHRTLQG